MRTPCDAGAMRSAGAAVPCAAEAKTWILAATILGSSMAFIDSTVVNVALPALQTSFHATVVDLQWVVESYGLFLAALILVGGSFGDLFGRRRMFVAGVSIFAVASAGCGFASSIQQLIIAQQHSRGGRRTARARQSCDYQRIFRREESGPGDWHMVGFHGDHYRDWAGAWRLAG